MKATLRPRGDTKATFGRQEETLKQRRAAIPRQPRGDIKATLRHHESDIEAMLRRNLGDSLRHQGDLEATLRQH